jgi:hypothetical protein
MAGLCLLTLSSCCPADAQQDVPLPVRFKFKAGQSVWLESYEYPQQLDGILLQVIANGDTIKRGGIGIVHNGPILACGDMVDIMQIGSMFRFYPSTPRPDAEAEPQEAAPDRLPAGRQASVPPLVVHSKWRVLPAPIVTRALEAEFRRQKKYRIAASPDTADFALWVLAVPAFDLPPGAALAAKDPLLSCALMLAIPKEHIGRKQAELQALAETVTGQPGDRLARKQRQLYTLMKDMPWEGVALGLGRGIALKDGEAQVSLRDLIRSLLKEAR